MKLSPLLQSISLLVIAMQGLSASLSYPKDASCKGPVGECGICIDNHADRHDDAQQECHCGFCSTEAPETESQEPTATAKGNTRTITLMLRGVAQTIPFISLSPEQSNPLPVINSDIPNIPPHISSTIIRA
ncbi:MAG: hypothetical protein GF350_14940 [Chitinivibrionales bacterium]|nr:hypothetical protein [Chitinivibrionales bacterium]